MTLPNPYQDISAQLDQSKAALRELAPVVAGFYTRLRESEVGRVDALVLTIGAFWQLSKKPQEEDDEYSGR